MGTKTAFIGITTRKRGVRVGGGRGSRGGRGPVTVMVLLDWFEVTLAVIFVGDPGARAGVTRVSDSEPERLEVNTGRPPGRRRTPGLRVGSLRPAQGAP